MRNNIYLFVYIAVRRYSSNSPLSYKDKTSLLMESTCIAVSCEPIDELENNTVVASNEVVEKVETVVTALAGTALPGICNQP